MKEYKSGTHEDLVYGGAPIILVNLCKEYEFDDGDFTYYMELATRKINEKFTEKETEDIIKNIFYGLDNQIARFRRGD